MCLPVLRDLCFHHRCVILFRFHEHHYIFNGFYRNKHISRYFVRLVSLIARLTPHHEIEDWQSEMINLLDYGYKDLIENHLLIAYWFLSQLGYVPVNQTYNQMIHELLPNGGKSNLDQITKNYLHQNIILALKNSHL